MALYTKEEIKAKIEALDAKISKAEDQQEYTSGGPGAGMHQVRGLLAAMYRERERLIKEYDKLEAAESYGPVNLAQFQRPQ